jgi:hypothetical protein
LSVAAFRRLLPPGKLLSFSRSMASTVPPIAVGAVSSMAAESKSLLALAYEPAASVMASFAYASSALAASW